MVSRFKQLLEYLQVNPSAFADRIGVQRSSISHVLSGRNKPSVDFLEKVLRAYPEVNARWLITGTGEWKAKEDIRSVKNELEEYSKHEETGQLVDYIIIVFKNNTFRILSSSG